MSAGAGSPPIVLVLQPQKTPGLAIDSVSSMILFGNLFIPVFSFQGLRFSCFCFVLFFLCYFICWYSGFDSLQIGC